MTEASTLSVIETYERHGGMLAALRGTELIEGLWLDSFCGLLPAGATVLDIG